MKKISNFVVIFTLCFSFAWIADGFAQIEFADPALDQCVRNKLGIAATDEITRELADGVTFLDCASGIFSAEGIENLTNLSVLYLDGNELSDIMSVMALKNLTHLSLKSNKISDVGQLNLTMSVKPTVDITDNCIRDFSPIDNNMLETVVLVGREDQRETCEKPGPPMDDTPQNTGPARPVLAQLADGRIDSGNFADAENDTLERVEWEIMADTKTVFSLYRGDAQLTIPGLFLNGNYQCRARFEDSGGGVSEWSEPLTATINQLDDDQNTNGVPDALEDGNPASKFPDLEPATAKFVNIMSAGTVIGTIGVEKGKNVNAITNLKSVDPVTLSETGKPAYLPLGLVAFKLAVTDGAIAEVVIHFSDIAADGEKWYAYNELAGEYTEYDATFAEDGKSVIVEIRDGGYGDVDGVENGFVVAPPSGRGADQPCALTVFTADPKTGDEPLTVKFNAAGSIGELSWDFGNGSDSGSDTECEHVYNESGTYKVTLTATGSNGCTKSTQQTIEVSGSGGGGGDCFIGTVFGGLW